MSQKKKSPLSPLAKLLKEAKKKFARGKDKSTPADAPKDDNHSL